jgi:hypothetical protein
LKLNNEQILAVMQIVLLDNGDVRIGFDPKYQREPDPWEDLAIAMEAVGLLTKVCINSGKTMHNGETIGDYLVRYVREAVASCRVAFEVKK